MLVQPAQPEQLEQLVQPEQLVQREKKVIPELWGQRDRKAFKELKVDKATKGQLVQPEQLELVVTTAIIQLLQTVKMAIISQI